MANLGNLWFSIGLKDQTDNDWAEIVKKVEKRGAKLGFTVDAKKLQQQIDAAISGKNYTIDLNLSVKDNQLEAAIRNAYNRMSGASASSIGGKPSRDDQLIRADAYAKAQAALERNRNALAALREARLRDYEATRRQRQANDALGKSADNTGRLVRGLRNEFLNFYSIYTVQSFLNSLIQVGGEFQKQHIALQAMLGDAAKADAIFSQIKELAVESPFNFQNLTGYTKQLAAFSIPYEELYDTTKRLADISAGLGVDMNRIILAYGQVRSAEFLRGTELRQFTEAGIPLLDQLAKKFSQLEGQVVSVGEVFDKISNREVPFEMVRDVLWDLTNEGGQFYKMQEVLTESLSGKLDKLKDSYQIMLSEVANSNNGVIGGSLDMLTNLTNHWRTLLNILQSLIVAWGAYKTATFAANVVDAIRIARTLRLTKALDANTISTIANARAQNGAALGGVKLLGTMSRLKTVLSGIGGAAGGWGLVISALAGISMYAYNAYQESQKLRKELEEIDEKAAGNIESLAYGYQHLVTKLGETQEGTKEYADLIKQINSSYGQYLDNLFSEAEAYDNVAKSVNGVTEAIVRKVQNQAYEQKVSAITENYTDKLADQQGKIANRIEDVYDVDEKLAKTMAGHITELIRQGETFSDAIKKVTADEETAYKTLTKERRANGRLVEIDDPAMEYAQLYQEFKRKIDEASISQSGYTPYSKQLDEIERKWTEINKQAKDADEVRLNTIKMYEEQLAKLSEMGVSKNDDTFSGIEQKLAAAKKPLEDWIRLANEAFSVPVNIGGKDFVIETLAPQESEYTKVVSYLERIVKSYREAGEEIEKLNRVEGTVGANEDWNRQIGRAKAIRSQVEKVFKDLGLDLNRWISGSSSSGGAGKDPVAEEWKERLELMKEAEAEYRKWEKLEGGAAARRRLEQSGLFASLGDFDFSKARESIKKFAEEMSREASTDEQRDVAKKGLQLSLGFQYDENKEALDKTLQDVEKHIQDVTKRWDLFKQLFEATGDRESSMQIAFGMSVPFRNESEQLLSELQNELSKKGLIVPIEMSEETAKLFLGDDAALFKLWKETKKAIEEDELEVRVNAAKAVGDMMSIAKKIKSLESQRDEELLSYTPGTADYEAISDKWEKQIMELRSSLLELDPAFQKIFQDTTGMSIRQIEALRQEAKKLLDLIAKTGSPVMDENGQVKGYQYTDASGRDMFIDIERYKDVQKRVEQFGKKASEVRIAFDRMWDWINGKDQGDGTKLTFRDTAKDLQLIAQEAGNAAGELGGMFDALGMGGMADGFSFAGEMLNSVGSIAEGISSGNPFAVIGGIAQGLTSIFQLHDKKLQREIEKSERAVKELQNTYDTVERALERYLGDGHSIKLVDAERDRQELAKLNGEIARIRGQQKINLWDLAALEKYAKESEKLQRRMEAYDEGGAYGYNRQLLEEQYAELEKQRQAEIDKKKTDKDKVLDYDAQLSELRDQITYFAQDLANELYGIDLKGWAQELGDALYDAWRAGENGAEAFRNKAGEIIAEVMNDIFRLRVLEPAMQDISDYLFGTDEERAANGGKGGVFGTDLELDNEEMKGLADRFMDMSEVSDEYTDMMDDLNEYLKKYGIDLKENADEAKDGLSAGIQSVTEDTAGLIASYLNGIRADVSVKRGLLERFIGEDFPKMSVLAQAQLTKLEQIEKNTGSNAESAAEILSLLRKNVQGGNKFHF